MRSKLPLALTLLLLVSLISCQPRQVNIQAYINATIIDGTGTSPISNGVLLVENGRVLAIGDAHGTSVPKDAEITDLQGKYIMPGMINTHGHIGSTEGLQGGRYSAENVLRDLKLNARYGVTTVVSLGGDGPASIDIRHNQDSLQNAYSRLFVAGTIVTGTNPDAVREVVRNNAQAGVDFIKIRVDDNLGRSVKMTPEVYSAVIDEAHKHNIPVASHLYYLADAKGLLRAGTDFIAHSIRDQLADQELIDLIKEKDVYYCPTLMREVSTFVYEDRPVFFDDPFFLREADEALLEALQDTDRQTGIRNSTTAQTYKKALESAKANLKLLSDNNVKIVMGTDAGPPARFQGYFEHKELELMVEAGLSPMQALMAATGNAADYLGLDDLGSLEPGKWADFLLLDKNPLEDISNTQRLSAVWINGKQVPTDFK